MSKFLRLYLPFSAVGVLIGGTVIFKDRMGGNTFDSKIRIPGKTVIVTGANCGIGKETARQMALKGAKVIMACRDMDKCTNAKVDIIQESLNRNVHCYELDLASCESIRHFASKINKTEKRVDVLVNNAGVMKCPKTLTTDGFEMQLGVNYLGHFLLTNLLLDKLKSCAPSRVINVTTLMYDRGKVNFEDLNSAKTYDSTDAYYQSKLALAFFTKELAKRLEGTGVSVYAVHPGVVKTKIGRHMGMNRSWISSAILGPVWWLVFKTPMQGAQTSMYCALEPTVSEDSGKLYSECKEKEWNDAVLDDATARRLWLISEKWTGLQKGISGKS